MRILVIGDSLLARTILRALDRTYLVDSGNAKNLELDLILRPEAILIDAAEMGMAGLEVVRSIKALGYPGKVFITQSEGLRLPWWGERLIKEGAIQGTFTVPWDLQALRAWADSINHPSH